MKITLKELKQMIKESLEEMAPWEEGQPPPTPPTAPTAVSPNRVGEFAKTISNIQGKIALLQSSQQVPKEVLDGINRAYLPLQAVNNYLNGLESKKRTGWSEE